MKQVFKRLLEMMGAYAQQSNQTEENTVKQGRTNNFGMHQPIYMPTRSQKIKSKQLAKRNAKR